MDRYRALKTLKTTQDYIIYKALDTITNEHVSIKKINIKFKNWSDALNHHEIKILQKINHPNIVGLKEILKNNNTFYLITDLLEITLRDYYEFLQTKKKKIPESEIRSIILSIAKAIQYLETRQIMHNDINSDNIFIYKDSIKLACFDNCIQFDKQQSKVMNGKNKKRSKFSYPAPEQLIKSDRSYYKSDIFSLGCLMAELFNQAPLFTAENDIHYLYKYCIILGTPNKNEWQAGLNFCEKNGIILPDSNGIELSQIISNASSWSIEAIKKMLKFDLVKRIDCKKILENRMLEDIEKILLEQQQKRKINQSLNKLQASDGLPFQQMVPVRQSYTSRGINYPNKVNKADGRNRNLNSKIDDDDNNNNTNNNNNICSPTPRSISVNIENYISQNKHKYIKINQQLEQQQLQQQLQQQQIEQLAIQQEEKSEQNKDSTQEPSNDIQVNIKDQKHFLSSQEENVEGSKQIQEKMEAQTKYKQQQRYKQQHVEMDLQQQQQKSYLEQQTINLVEENKNNNFKQLQQYINQRLPSYNLSNLNNDKINVRRNVFSRNSNRNSPHSYLLSPQAQSPLNYAIRQSNQINSQSFNKQNTDRFDNNMNNYVPAASQKASKVNSNRFIVKTNKDMTLMNQTLDFNQIKDRIEKQKINQSLDLYKQVGEQFQSQNQNDFVNRRLSFSQKEAGTNQKKENLLVLQQDNIKLPQLDDDLINSFSEAYPNNQYQQQQSNNNNTPALSINSSVGYNLLKELNMNLIQQDSQIKQSRTPLSTKRVRQIIHQNDDCLTPQSNIQELYPMLLRNDYIQNQQKQKIQILQQHQFEIANLIQQQKLNDNLQPGLQQQQQQQQIFQKNSSNK